MKTGAVTERVKLVPYMIIDFINIAFIFVIPAHWIWDENGWLRKMGAFDFGGAAVIHITGGIIALVGALMVGPRDERFGARSDEYQMSNPVYPLLATLVLLTQWIGFNCGATVAVSGGKSVLQSIALRFCYEDSFYLDNFAVKTAKRKCWTNFF